MIKNIIFIIFYSLACFGFGYYYANKGIKDSGIIEIKPISGEKFKIKEVIIYKDKIKYISETNGPGKNEIIISKPKEWENKKNSIFISYSPEIYDYSIHNKINFSYSRDFLNKYSIISGINLGVKSLGVQLGVGYKF